MYFLEQNEYGSGSQTLFLLQNSSLQDHLKSKKHMKTVEEKKERYPDIMKMMMAQTRVAPPEETDRPNNGDRLQYR